MKTEELLLAFLNEQGTDYEPVQIDDYELVETELRIQYSFEYPWDVGGEKNPQLVEFQLMDYITFIFNFKKSIMKTKNKIVNKGNGVYEYKHHDSLLVVNTDKNGDGSVWEYQEHSTNELADGIYSLKEFVEWIDEEFN